MLFFIGYRGGVLSLYSKTNICFSQFATPIYCRASGFYYYFIFTLLLAMVSCFVYTTASLCPCTWAEALSAGLAQLTSLTNLTNLTTN
jgi:hypothetical protein